MPAFCTQILKRAAVTKELVCKLDAHTQPAAAVGGKLANKSSFLISCANKLDISLQSLRSKNCRVTEARPVGSV